MRIPTKRIEYFSELYANAKLSAVQLYDDFERNISQYRGTRQLDGTLKEASLVRNITYELIESQVSTSIPSPVVNAPDGGRSRLSESAEMLCKRIRDSEAFEKMNDCDERYTYIYGGSVWFAEWNGKGVSVNCISPRYFVAQPGVYDIDQMEYCFLEFSTTADEAERRYGKRIDTKGCEADNPMLIVCFFRNSEGGVGRFVWSGETILADDEDFYGRRYAKCSSCGKEYFTSSEYDKGFCICGGEINKIKDEYEILSEDIEQSDGARIPSGERIKWYAPTRFPIVIRKNISKEESWIGQSDCECVRYQQQEINKIESRIHSKLMRSAVLPVMPDDAAVQQTNGIFEETIRLKPSEDKNRFGILDTTPTISGDICQSERMYEHARRILGISNTFQGIDDNSAQSGYAKQIMVNQSKGRMTSKRVMKNAAYAELDRIIFELYLAFSDERIRLCYCNPDGEECVEYFSRYDYAVKKKDCWEYVSDFIFSVDNGCGEEGENRSIVWDYVIKMFEGGLFGDTSDAESRRLCWSQLNRLKFPNAAFMSEKRYDIKNECQDNEGEIDI